MRIHTSLTSQQMYDARKASGAPIEFEFFGQHGSRTHPRSFEVILSGSSTSRSQSGNYWAATWDEWGAFLAALYNEDIDARCGGSVKHPTYRDAEHFHFATGSRFGTLTDKGFLPADTHPRHKWDYQPRKGGFRCTHIFEDGSTCSAYRPSWKKIEAYAPRVYT